ncbi:MAG: metal ABC transporter permease [Holophagales bacterium]|jgi:zinc transport system permease protein|nr:metal ABC transporter permease [Holophagales bacterium]MBK9964195.1 metal ABC transporter permease [Holophagales bacterium]
MSFALVFDPLFRVPFANGLLLALVLPLLGSYVRLRNEWLAALGLAQVTAAGGVVAILLGIHPLAGAIGAAVLAAGVKGRTERSGNDVYAVLLFFGWSAALLGAANSVRGEELSHALLEGQLYFTTWANLGGAVVLFALVAAAGPWLSRRLLLEHFFPEHLSANGQAPWRLHLAFDLLVALSVALATESIGVMATFCLVFFPPWVAFRIAASWKRALVHAVGISVTAYLAAFVVAIVLNQPFGPVLVGTLVLGGVVRLPFLRPR